MQTGGLESTGEWNSDCRESKWSRAIAPLQGQVANQDVGKREGPIEIYPEFWNLNPVARDAMKVLRIPAWTKSFEFATRELEIKFERDVLPAAIPELPTVRQMTFGMNSPMIVPYLHASAAVEQHQRVFTDSCDPLFIEYLAAVCFHTCENKINLWNTLAKNSRSSMPLKVRGSGSSEDA